MIRCTCDWSGFLGMGSSGMEPDPDCPVHFPKLPPSANTGNTARSSGWYGGHE